MGKLQELRDRESQILQHLEALPGYTELADALAQVRLEKGDLIRNCDHPKDRREYVGSDRDEHGRTERWYRCLECEKVI